MVNRRQFLEIAAGASAALALAPPLDDIDRLPDEAMRKRMAELVDSVFPRS